MSGGFFAYKLALPKAFRFLLEFASQFQPMVTINEYWDLAISIIVAVGLVFELPVVILLLSVFGIVTPKFLFKNFRYAVLLTAVVAAALVPTNDMATIFVVWIPLLGLYILSIGLSWLVYLKKKQEKEKCRCLSVKPIGSRLAVCSFLLLLAVPALAAPRAKRRALTAVEPLWI